MWYPFLMFPYGMQCLGLTWRDLPIISLQHLTTKGLMNPTSEFLDKKEALEFDPTVEPTTWTPSQAIISFLEKHFNRCLADNEKEAILSNFPKPNTPVLEAPKLDEEVKEQLRSKRKDHILVRRKSFLSYRNLSWMCQHLSHVSGQT